MKQIVLCFAVFHVFLQFLIEQSYTKTLYFLVGQILQSLLDLNQLITLTKQNSVNSGHRKIQLKTGTNHYLIPSWHWKILKHMYKAEFNAILTLEDTVKHTYKAEFNTILT